MLHCPNAEFILQRAVLDQCYRTDDTFVCPQHVLKTVNDTRWLGLPWNKDAKLNFVRRHKQAPDCSNIHNLYHLGGRYYLSTQQGLLPVFNTTNGSSHLISLTPLTVYHFPFELTFATQQTGLGTCPHSITLHLPLFSSTSLRYIPWQNNDDHLLKLHYQSLNFTPPLHFDNKTLSSLDHTFRLLDGQFTSQLLTLKQDISHLHSVSSTTLNDRLAYFALALTLLNTLVIKLLYCSIKHSSNQPLFRSVLFTRKQPPKSSAHAPSKTLTVSASDTELEALPSTANTDICQANSACSTCNKPVSV